MMPSKHYGDKRRSIRNRVQRGTDGTFPRVRVIWYLEGMQTRSARGESKLGVKCSYNNAKWPGGSAVVSLWEWVNECEEIHLRNFKQSDREEQEREKIITGIRACLSAHTKRRSKTTGVSPDEKKTSSTTKPSVPSY